ncbi:MAG: hypothetical protein VW258_02035 [Thalassolituus sp.]
MTIAIIVTALLAAALLFHPMLRRRPLWRATITPLASIIGSGFLVLGPVLVHEFGVWAPAVMGLLCLLAWGFGAAIRANIARIGEWPAPDSQAERIGGWVLSIAYMVSVAYYLNLLGSFAVSMTPWGDGIAGRLVTSGVYLLILVLGVWRGFEALESVEYPAVAIKLAVIVALITALGIHASDSYQAGNLQSPVVHFHGWAGLTLVFGLLITVQGFETSRYLFHSYSARQRIKSMKLAQAVSAIIYLVYVVLLTFAIAVPDDTVSETEIISLMSQVAPVMAILLVVAALAAQFSAAVADTGGAGGLLEEVSRKMFSERQGYIAVVVVGLILTWMADVFTIIAIASRAFALYYAVQCYIAANHSEGNKRVLFGIMGGIGLGAALLGTPVEG